MIEIEKGLREWTELLKEFHIPRWNELPVIELYADQVVVLIEGYIGPLFEDREKIITASMIHNYVKLGLIPGPVKKRYNRLHIAYLITITILKHVLTISEIKAGIVYQTRISDKKTAYNLFCEEQEYAVKIMSFEIFNFSDKKEIEASSIAIRMSAYAFASKILAQKAIRLQSERMI